MDQSSRRSSAAAPDWPGPARCRSLTAGSCSWTRPGIGRYAAVPRGAVRAVPGLPPARGRHRGVAVRAGRHGDGANLPLPARQRVRAHPDPGRAVPPGVDDAVAVAVVGRVPAAPGRGGLMPPGPHAYRPEPASDWHLLALGARWPKNSICAGCRWTRTWCGRGRCWSATVYGPSWPRSRSRWPGGGHGRCPPCPPRTAQTAWTRSGPDPWTGGQHARTRGGVRARSFVVLSEQSGQSTLSGGYPRAGAPAGQRDSAGSGVGV